MEIRLHSYTHHALLLGLCLPATLIPGLPSPLAATLGPQSACVLPAQPTKRETDFYIMLCPVYLFSTCCCFKQSSLRLTVPSCCLSYCTELAVAESSKKPEPMQHLRLVRFFLHISSVACHICALINPSMCLHSWSVRSLGLCFNAISGRVLQES